MYNIRFVILVSFILLFFSNSLIAIGDGTNSKKGIERIERKGDNWQWGTCGHGSFDNAIHAFNADNDVESYTTKQGNFRVFTRGNKNYVEMLCLWGGGVYTYYTNNPYPESDFANPAEKSPLSADSKAGSDKMDRVSKPWDWGTYGFGSFDITVATLKAEGDVVSFRQSGRAKYRVFTHGRLNFIEVDYGWGGGVFRFTTRK